ncbi:MAG: RimK domain protein ATP-grasp [Herminiimonas sp.]|nr:RimK domain protein ATP-grasp [Herminiimonas sp.]MDB5852344.1 RimK domain protein ATP-grasp [Herminiimonas sp.]
MNLMFVVSRIKDWPFHTDGVSVLSAQTYLTGLANAEEIDKGETRVFNLCTDCSYQSPGYYVSMLAEARGHHPLPDVRALEDLQSDGLMQRLTDRLDPVLQQALDLVATEADADSFSFDMLFGRTQNPCLDPLAEQLFNLLRLPLAEMNFERRGDRWHLRSVQALAVTRLEPDRLRRAAHAAADCAGEHRQRPREPAARKPRIAILRTPDSPSLPSNPAAIQKFQEAAEALGMRSDVVTTAHCVELEGAPAYDALFIRDTTHVNDYTYRLARQCASAGMIVLDDPDSILKCNNKLFMSELLSRHRIPIPRTMMVHRGNLDRVIPELGLPCVLKQPDGAFSRGVEKIESAHELEEVADRMFESSGLLLAQEYLPTAFDWRIGILDRRPLFVCKYHMARGHWQIIKHEEGKAAREGLAEAVPLDRAPVEVIDTALKAANLIGDGFYGVDLKQRGHQCSVIEINDNPNVDAGNEDGIIQDALYREVMTVLRHRIETRKGSAA